MAGIFITFEGPDGAGKTTQVKLLERHLRQKGYDVLVTREPGGTPVGEEIRKILLNRSYKDMDAVTEMYLYAASRAQHVRRVIKPALDEGKMVLCDRFVDSSVAYQGFGRGLGMDVVEAVNRYALGGIVPDLTLFLNIRPEDALARGRIRSEELDRLESEELEFHRRVYQGFLVLQKKYTERIKEVDASRSVDEVFEQVRRLVEYLLSCKK
ncbi:dTMP kinase [Caldicoprobacter algeriensis]|uniref:dTMP kinase n=1 Tax=Caldicoprobacter algeriensis TaxID=699281 RepID=UPI00207A4475|nr:dTMP kinase [Caldicoprobacter algeriensis]MCM8901861.1 dTMP kinase [Caldicoprobacter algeriensis]